MSHGHGDPGVLSHFTAQTSLMEAGRSTAAPRGDGEWVGRQTPHPRGWSFQLGRATSTGALNVGAEAGWGWGGGSQVSRTPFDHTTKPSSERDAPCCPGAPSPGTCPSLSQGRSSSGFPSCTFLVVPVPPSPQSQPPVRAISNSKPSQ